MPKRIEHIINDGEELKWCPRCKEFITLDNFTVNSARWDKLSWLCKAHASEEWFKSSDCCANQVWRNIQIRVAEHPRYTSRGIQVRITKDEFTVWYKENWFEGCMVDRIDNEGHYEIGNLQLISRVDHNHKAREDKLKSLGVVEPDGLRYCYKCGEFKKYDEFYRRTYKVSIKNPLGLIEACGECCRKERRKRFELQRETSL